MGWPDRSRSAIDLADIIEPLQCYLLTCSADQNVFVDADSVSSCVEMLEEFGDRALQPSYDPWTSVNFHARAKIHADLANAYKDVRIAANVEADADVILSSGSPEKQRKRPAQGPRIDLSKTSKAVAAETCVSKLRFLVLVVVAIVRNFY